jgi:hypothetical protein
LAFTHQRFWVHPPSFDSKSFYFYGEPMFEQNVSGYIYKLSPLGWIYVLSNADGKAYFLHRDAIKAGADLVQVGQPVRFDIAPAFPGGKYPRAINAVISAQPVVEPSAPPAPSTEPTTLDGVAR